LSLPTLGGLVIFYQISLSVYYFDLNFLQNFLFGIYNDSTLISLNVILIMVPESINISCFI
jgi:hypothetical protein